jgi:glycosyltransferase involved in cell wall biosynthesis
VISNIGSEVNIIYVIDDKCPEESGNYVLAQCTDPRVVVRFNNVNLGVGGAVLTGYRAALEDGADIIIKIDGDGQMDPSLIPFFIKPIIDGQADYSKGNRFFNLNQVKSMPGIRLLGNAALSFLNKLSSGYWDIFDPTNGYTAIHADVLRQLPLEKISNRYFFESDMLFRLNLQKAVVVDIAMDAKYGDEISNLKISKVAGEFLFKHIRNLSKRVFYNYYLRDMSLASIELPLGLILFIFGTVFGLTQWANSAAINMPTPAGTVMLAALPTLMGLQLILAFLAFDINSVPRVSSRGNRAIKP